MGVAVIVESLRAGTPARRPVGRANKPVRRAERREADQGEGCRGIAGNHPTLQTTKRAQAMLEIPL